MEEKPHEQPNKIPGASPVGETAGVFETLERKQKEGVRWGAFWWTLSITVHVSVVAAIIWFTPLREYFLKQTDRRDVIAKVPEGQGKVMVTHMMSAATNRVRSRVEELRSIAEDLLKYRDSTQKRYFVMFPKDKPDVLGSAGPPIDVPLKDGRLVRHRRAAELRGRGKAGDGFGVVFHAAEDGAPRMDVCRNGVGWNSIHNPGDSRTRTYAPCLPRRSLTWTAVWRRIGGGGGGNKGRKDRRPC
jgi:hypothetical protein